MSLATITGKIQDIAAGTTARAIVFESLGIVFDTGGTVTVNTSKSVTCNTNGTFSTSLWGGSYRVIVEDTWKRSFWYITVPNDGGTYDISAIRVTTPPASATLYYTADAVLALLLLKMDKLPTGGNVRFKNGNFQHYNPDTALWHTQVPRGPADAIYSDWSAGEA